MLRRRLWEADMVLDAQTLQAVQDALGRGNRVELIPVKDGVKALEIHRKELNQRPASKR